MNKIIAAVRTTEALKEAMDSNVNIVFDLNPEINTLSTIVKYVHQKGKKIFIHFDLAQGIGKDKSGILYAKSLGIDGIISTRSNIIKIAKENGIPTVQRFFALDSQSVTTTIESLKSSKADMIEIMPGIAAKVIKKLKKSVAVPIIAGGLIETEEEVREAIANGASAVSTGTRILWNI